MTCGVNILLPISLVDCDGRRMLIPFALCVRKFYLSGFITFEFFWSWFLFFSFKMKSCNMIGGERWVNSKEWR